ncbi:hypothetical protein [Wolbachia endosymbiont of Ctenocephalides felis wCfeJ]|uniref:hypothetical protein n=1 Tax=Wolbachia endosymbiont of Ctenocephalides felis wCfeJ TaxID=2732594 RepID=UPI001447F189|nr:hypothetical protein [Wolbachia endosymbiont of Ctenocephalides felis wCfeJ]WCR57552.1 MAG: hypothetical protein PG980_000024 [Wolbachia endosymbiont of Ctenocephalides felis wCfeJ]
MGYSVDLREKAISLVEKGKSKYEVAEPKLNYQFLLHFSLFSHDEILFTEPR